MSEEAKTTMSEELALEEVKRWAEANDIDLMVKSKDGEDVFDAAVPKLVKCVQQGRLVVNDEDGIEYTISNKSPEGVAGEKIVLTAPTTAGYMAMDKYKDKENIHKMLALAAAMTGKDVAWFAKLHNTDYKVITIIVNFFIVG